MVVAGILAQAPVKEFQAALIFFGIAGALDIQSQQAARRRRGSRFGRRRLAARTGDLARRFGVGAGTRTGTGSGRRFDSPIILVPVWLTLPDPVPGVVVIFGIVGGVQPLSDSLSNQPGISRSSRIALRGVAVGAVRRRRYNRRVRGFVAGQRLAGFVIPAQQVVFIIAAQ